MRVRNIGNVEDAIEPRRGRDERGSLSGRRARVLGLALIVFGALMMVLSARDAALGAVPVTAPGALVRASFGGSKADEMRGGSPDQELFGLGGGDELWGGAGTDVLRGGPGDDELYGGDGRDVLLGGPGDDFIEAKDGYPDRVVCGPGDDVASLDPLDTASADCETVYQ